MPISLLYRYSNHFLNKLKNLFLKLTCKKKRCVDMTFFQVVLNTWISISISQFKFPACWGKKPSKMRIKLFVKGANRWLQKIQIGNSIRPQCCTFDEETCMLVLKFWSSSMVNNLIYRVMFSKSYSSSKATNPDGDDSARVCIFQKREMTPG